MLIFKINCPTVAPSPHYTGQEKTMGYGVIISCSYKICSKKDVRKNDNLYLYIHKTKS
jgi:hypothetical protein